MRVTGLCGSIRAKSYTRRALAVTLQGAEELGARTRLIDLRDYSLVFCAGKDEEYPYPPDVSRLRQALSQAQGIILATPEYHGSFSGVLKNALDLMGFEQFEGKMVGLVGVSGGRMGAIDGLNSLRTISRALHAWVVPEQASIPQAWKEFDDHGALKDRELENRLREVGRQVARFAYLHNSEHALEFVRNWESALENPGGGEAVE